MRVQIIRGAGTRRAANIVEPLLTTEAAGMQRGRNFLDSEGFDAKTIEVIMPYRLMCATGCIIEVMDGETSQIFRAKLLGYSYTVTAPTENQPLKIVTRCTLERPLIA